MSKEYVSRQSQGSPSAGSTGGSSQSLPDVNAEVYPYEMVQHLLDQTANFNMFAMPVENYSEIATLTPGDPSDFFGLNGGYGVDIFSDLRRFDSIAQPPTQQGGLKATHAVGDLAGTFHSRWIFSPDDFQWSPGKYPPPAIYDPWASQRFVMVEGEFTFGDSDSFCGNGIGRTYPLVVNGRPRLLAGAVGNITEGFGKFSGLKGTYVLTGALTRNLGFMGNITCRVVDPEGNIRSDRELAALTTISNPDPEDTFIALRLVKKDRSVKTTYGPPPGGGLVSLITPSQMRSVQYNYTTEGGGGVHTEMRVGQVIGKMDATVFFNLLSPPGTAQSPVPFTTDELYEFVDSNGHTVGTITARIVEGISFELKFPAAPGQPGVRFAGFGPLTGGTGAFAGAQGMLTVNSVIGISPHALSLMHVLHLIDPQGKFRTTGKYWAT